MVVVVVVVATPAADRREEPVRRASNSITSRGRGDRNSIVY